MGFFSRLFGDSFEDLGESIKDKLNVQEKDKRTGPPPKPKPLELAVQRLLDNAGLAAEQDIKDVNLQRLFFALKLNGVTPNRAYSFIITALDKGPEAAVERVFGRDRFEMSAGAASLTKENAKEAFEKLTNLASTLEDIHIRTRTEFDEIFKIPDATSRSETLTTTENEQRNYILNRPDMLFVSEYVVDNEFIGYLVAWEDYSNSTHYEVFKKNMFDARDKDFEKILFLDRETLQKETDDFYDYITNTLGLSEFTKSNSFVILDDVVKQDRIYEYKIKAARIPFSADKIDYDLILESRGGLSKPATPGGRFVLYNAGLTHFDSKIKSWLISLVSDNDFYNFFGRSSIFGAPSRTIPYVRPLMEDDVKEILVDSIFLFGIKETYRHLLFLLGGLSETFIDIFIKAIDEEKLNFNYSNFFDWYRREFSNLASVVSSNKSVKPTDRILLKSGDYISLSQPTNFKSLTSLEDIGKILDYVNRVLIYTMDSAELDVREERSEEEISDLFE